MLTRHETELVRETAERLDGAPVLATDVFYTNLFAAAPSVRPLFPEDMFGQSEKLWQLLASMVAGLDNFDSLIPELRRLGARHVEYGAQPEHYPIVTQVLVETLESLLPDIWTPAHGQAWQKALDRVAEVMLEGALDEVR